MNLIHKECRKCLSQKDITLFYKNKAAKDGLTTVCKVCIKIYSDEYRKVNKEVLREKAKNNKDQKKEYAKAYWVKNSDKLSKHYKKYRIENPEKVKISGKKWRDSNKTRIKAWRKNYNNLNKDKIAEYYRNNTEYFKRYRKIYVKSKLESDVNFRLAKSIRRRLWNVTRTTEKGGSAVKEMGCSLSFLKIYLEPQFTEGMEWDNWGTGYGKWQIDHIMPLTAFDLTNKQHFILACHYGNLRPLWYEDNMRKFDKVPTPENYKELCYV